MERPKGRQCLRPTDTEVKAALAEETNKWRIFRLQQVRAQSNQLTAARRERVVKAEERQLQQLREELQQQCTLQQQQRLEQLQQQLQCAVSHVGSAHKAAQEQEAASAAQAARKAELELRAQERGLKAIQLELRNRRALANQQQQQGQQRRLVQMQEKRRAQKVARLPTPPAQHQQSQDSPPPPQPPPVVVQEAGSLASSCYRPAPHTVIRHRPERGEQDARSLAEQERLRAEAAERREEQARHEAERRAAERGRVAAERQRLLEWRARQSAELQPQHLNAFLRGADASDFSLNDAVNGNVTAPSHDHPPSNTGWSRRAAASPASFASPTEAGISGCESSSTLHGPQQGDLDELWHEEEVEEEQWPEEEQWREQEAQDQRAELEQRVAELLRQQQSQLSYSTSSSSSSTESSTPVTEASSPSSEVCSPGFDAAAALGRADELMAQLRRLRELHSSSSVQQESSSTADDNSKEHDTTEDDNTGYDTTGNETNTSPDHHSQQEKQLMREESELEGNLPNLAVSSTSGSHAANERGQFQFARGNGGKMDIGSRAIYPNSDVTDRRDAVATVSDDISSCDELRVRFMLQSSSDGGSETSVHPIAQDSSSAQYNEVKPHKGDKLSDSAEFIREMKSYLGMAYESSSDYMSPPPTAPLQLPEQIHDNLRLLKQKRENIQKQLASVSRMRAASTRISAARTTGVGISGAGVSGAGMSNTGAGIFGTGAGMSSTGAGSVLSSTGTGSVLSSFDAATESCVVQTPSLVNTPTRVYTENVKQDGTGRRPLRKRDKFELQKKIVLQNYIKRLLNTKQGDLAHLSQSTVDGSAIEISSVGTLARLVGDTTTGDRQRSGLDAMGGSEQAGESSLTTSSGAGGSSGTDSHTSTKSSNSSISTGHATSNSHSVSTGHGTSNSHSGSIGHGTSNGNSNISSACAISSSLSSGSYRRRDDSELDRVPSRLSDISDGDEGRRQPTRHPLHDPSVRLSPTEYSHDAPDHPALLTETEAFTRKLTCDREVQVPSVAEDEERKGTSSMEEHFSLDPHQGRTVHGSDGHQPKADDLSYGQPPVSQSISSSSSHDLLNSSITIPSFPSSSTPTLGHTAATAPSTVSSEVSPIVGDEAVGPSLERLAALRSVQSLKVSGLPPAARGEGSGVSASGQAYSSQAPAGSEKYIARIPYRSKVSSETEKGTSDSVIPVTDTWESASSSVADTASSTTNGEQTSSDYSSERPSSSLSSSRDSDEQEVRRKQRQIQLRLAQLKEIKEQYLSHLQQQQLQLQQQQLLTEQHQQELQNVEQLSSDTEERLEGLQKHQAMIHREHHQRLQQHELHRRAAPQRGEGGEPDDSSEWTTTLDSGGRGQQRDGLHASPSPGSSETVETAPDSETVQNSPAVTSSSQMTQLLPEYTQTSLIGEQFNESQPVTANPSQEPSVVHRDESSSSTQDAYLNDNQASPANESLRMLMEIVDLKKVAGLSNVSRISDTYNSPVGGKHRSGGPKQSTDDSGVREYATPAGPPPVPARLTASVAGAAGSDSSNVEETLGQQSLESALPGGGHSSSRDWSRVSSTSSSAESSGHLSSHLVELERQSLAAGSREPQATAASSSSSCNFEEVLQRLGWARGMITKMDRLEQDLPSTDSSTA